MSRVCGVCGIPAPPPFRAPPPELAPDLDLRPGEPTRSTLARWLQTCGGCGAVAPDLAMLTNAAGETVRSDDYRALRAEPPEALPALRWAMLCSQAERAEALLQGAWAADDAGVDAASLRVRAANEWGEPTSIESALRLIDVLRRARQFAAAEARASDLAARPRDENSERILAYQRARIASGDAGRHMISSALRPPASMPHVAHGKRASRGFWARMMGR